MQRDFDHRLEAAMVLKQKLMKWVKWELRLPFFC